MTGSTLFLLKKTNNFEKSFKKLAKAYKSKTQQQEFITVISEYLEALRTNPYPPQSRSEPLPKGIKLPDDIEFYKLVIKIAKGASGQIRVMYLVNQTTKIIQLLWIYSHEEFAKRPPDTQLKNLLQNSLEEE